MDIRLRAISEKHNFKIFIIDITQTVKEIAEMQKTNPLATIVLGKITAANTLLGLDLKSGEVMSSSLQTQDGYVGKIITEFQNDKIRSYIQKPDFDASEIFNQEQENPYTLALGKKGTLTVARQLRGYEPYVSQVDLLDGGIDSDFMEYAKTSNQIKTLIATKVELNEDLSLKAVVGFLIQLFPNHTEADIEYLDQKINNSQGICQQIIASENQQKIIYQIADDAIMIEEPQTLAFECTCNQQKSLMAIKLLGEAEIKQLIDEDQPVTVTCDFCKKKYLISLEELHNLTAKH